MYMSEFCCNETIIQYNSMIHMVLRVIDHILLCVPAGAGTALLGKEGAMACTVAVEESISEHYNSQIRALMEEDPDRYVELLKVR